MRIGVLALQGAFIEHEKMLSCLGADCFEIRRKDDLKKSHDGLILCGGESTVQGKLIKQLDMQDYLCKEISEGLPTFGTCAGLILLAKDIYGGEQPHLALMDIVAKRNAYGRQLGSFNCDEQFYGVGYVPMTFIRAPYIMSAGQGVQQLALHDGKIVAARQNNMLVTAFHPELTTNLSVHSYFLNMVTHA
jgi:5'-phosphate synthase pdxT subunit